MTIRRPLECAHELEIKIEIMVRRACRLDAEAVGRFLAGLSSASRRQRFFNSLPYVSPSLAQKMVTITPSRLVLLALHGDTVVGHVMAGQIGDHAAEVGIVVADAHQHRGIGDHLLHDLTGTLTRFGVTDLYCDVLSENYLVLAWLGRRLHDIRYERSGETTSVYGRLIKHAS